MRSVFPWYIFALLGLLLTGIGISGVVLESIFPGSIYIVGGLLLFGASVVGHRVRMERRKTYSDVSPELVRELKTLVREDRSVEAVRHYRLHTGCDLMEAKAYIDEMREKLKEQQEE